MSSKILFLLLVLNLNHPEFQTEWWYYTGNLQSADGHRYGYELTFFRQANADAPKSKSVWNPDELYLAHLALSDIDGQKFEHSERLNRAGPGLAGPSWNGNWHVQDQELQAVASDFTLKLKLQALKPSVINGVDGVSRKGPAKNEFSHYGSFTRIRSGGKLSRDGKSIELTGLSWMDHEYFNDSDDPTLRGWDWFAIQLENNEELMLYRLRLKSGEVSPYSSGTFIDAQGQARHLTAQDFKLTPGDNWNSPASKATYPIAWSIEIQSLDIKLAANTRLKQQEIYTPNSVSPGYWEGAVEYTGTEHGKLIKGRGYLEMTGYLAPLRLGH
jgi:predicted secreted hydrolase